MEAASVEVTSLRPQDLPELRADLLADAIRRYGDGDWDRLASWEAYRPYDELRGQKIDGEDLFAATQRTLGGELYFVSEEMTELAFAAGDSLPAFPAEPEDLPSPAGLLLLESPSDQLERQEGQRVAGFAWVTLEDWAMWITPLWTSARGPRFGFPVLYPFRVEEYVARSDATAVRNAHRRYFTIRAMWLLMQQSLTRTTEIEPDRAVRKRLRRMNHEPAPVRVIELRRPEGGGSHGDGSREYHHQWITRGHWRNQWHPKREVHRPVWIAPYIKGPAGAPLIGGEKVYALKR